MIENLTLLEKAALLTGKSVWETYDLPRHGVRSLWLADGPHGVRKQVGSADHLGLNASEPATCFPTAAAVANTWDVELAESVGMALGAEAAAQGVDVLLGPGLNIKRSPLGGRSFEYFSEDPLLAGKMAAGYVRGIQSQGVAACPKHFAANSQELRRMVSDSVVDERTLREVYLTAFGIVVTEAKPRTIMSAYNLVNGVYAHEDPFLLTQVLREEWGFDGAVVSDWGGSNDIVAAVAAGGTLEMPAAGLDSARQIVEAVRSGRLAEADLDARADEMLRLVADAREPGTAEAVDLDAHHALARSVAARSAVLLKNDDAILPLAPGTRVAVIGDFAQTPRYQGSGSSAVNPTRLDSFVDVVAGSGLDVTAVVQGFRRDGTPDAALHDAAVQAARGADVVLLFLGLDEVAESEGLDRSTLSLHRVQTDLLAAIAEANPATVVVLAGGGAIETPWLGSARALVHGYLAGQAGAGGMLDVLTGEVNPSGRLAETMPLALADTPTAGAFPALGRSAEYREGLFVGYRYYTSAGAPVAFPFGFGLSYTTFAHSALSASQDSATVTVTNTGDVAGADVVQVYVRRVSPGVHRPARTLAGFARVELEPGASATVSVPLGDAAFRHWDTATGAWQVEHGSWEVLAGAHVDDLPLAVPVEVTGTVPARAEDVPARYRTGDVQDVPDADFAALLGRDVPAAAWSGPLTVNDALDRMATARSPLARLAYRVLAWRRDVADRKGAPDLNILFLLNMPLRAVGKMTGGMVSAEMVDGLVRIVNGHFLSGFGATARAFFRNRRANRATLRDLRRDA
ncbi:glycoside hydrolase family 3 C-terminal domain-containing protein [Cellulomonas cellasea]|uniref:glycoside hydrolase family 3 C-terminal domain-containing protein n=1 Tax=Cellulomonas cellasea TaxID=43670 RepID=UPI0025A4AC0A|nr:glycoside hydrolase family 3 C-terminal domain-containing protein [Cellulomonas cellasea]MDM8085333.1 glycoside hydrolase family 3 C-terminal domain-containing protein [Cellulomonas cellasea]